MKDKDFTKQSKKDIDIDEVVNESDENTSSDRRRRCIEEMRESIERIENLMRKVRNEDSGPYYRVHYGFRNKKTKRILGIG